MNKLTKKQATELNYLASLPDEAIDTADIAEQTDWKNAKIGRFYCASRQNAVKVDKDILAWFKTQSGHRYQHMINQALRDYIQHPIE
jgi:uncharacterized protein (DUF4415 family)